MSLPLAFVLFIVGLGLVLYFAEKLVSAVVGTAVAFRASAFWISVVFVGFDPENLAVGATGSYEGLFGIALGSVIGATMVAIALALGVTALVVPLQFGEAPRRILLVPVAAVALASGLMVDRALSRVDGVILLLGYVVAVVYLLRLKRGGVDIKPGGEVQETLEKEKPAGRWKSLGLLVLSLAAIVVGSEMVISASRRFIAGLGWSDTLFGMTLLAFLISIEELARELPAAIRKRPDITYGNVAGSVLAFFLFNLGVIALVRPIRVDAQTLTFYLPICAGTVVLTSLLVATRRVPRWAGALLVAVYAAFVALGILGVEP